MNPNSYTREQAVSILVQSCINHISNLQDELAQEKPSAHDIQESIAGAISGLRLINTFRVNIPASQAQE